MLKERENLIKHIMMFADFVIIVTGFFVVYYFQVYFHEFYELDLIPFIQVVKSPSGLEQYMFPFFLWALLWVTMLTMNGMYHSLRTRSFSEIAGIILKSSFISAFGFAGLTFLFKMHFVSRTFFVLSIVLVSGLLVVEKWILVLISRSARRKGFNFRRMLIVGTGARTERYIKMIQEHPEWGLQIMGLIDDESSRVNKEFYGVKVIGVLNDIPKILRENVIDEVLFVVPRQWLVRIQECISSCELSGVRTSVAADFFDLKIARAHQSDLNGFPLLVFETTFGREWQLLVKRTVDLFISFFLLIFLLPFLLFISILIKLTSDGPVFFKQKRVTLNGRIFTLYKFRSMVKDANKRLEGIKHLNEMQGPVFKIKNDPRITPLGRFLRKTSIDELPQFFNVFMGHISLVGPRPPLSTEVKEYELWQIRRLSMRAGLTCLWQISGRNNVGFDEWMKMDLEYIDNWSLWTDLKILSKTLPAVLFGLGAN